MYREVLLQVAYMRVSLSVVMNQEELIVVPKWGCHASDTRCVGAYGLISHAALVEIETLQESEKDFDSLSR